MAQLISIGQVIDNTFHLYQKHFGSYVRIGSWLFLSVPLFVLSTVLAPLMKDTVTAIFVIGGITVVNTILTIIVGYFVGNGFIFATDAYHEEKKSDPATLRQKAWSRVGAAFTQGILLALMLLGAACLVLPGVGLFVASTFMENPGVVVPALGMFLLFAGCVAAGLLVIWFAVIFAFAPMALIVEQRSVVDAIRRAFALVRGRWWATMIRVFIPKATLGIIIFFGQMLIVLFFFILTTGLAPVAETIGEGTVVIILAVLQQLAVIGVAAVTTSAFVIADYYVFRDLVATRRTTS